MRIDTDVKLTDASSPRKIIGLEHGWKFRYAADEGALAPNCDETDWDSVVVPHTWNQADATRPDYQRGAGWYRLRFTSPRARPTNRSYLEFDGANLVASVWLNGRELGTHWGGYARFRFDATDALEPGRQNLLVVRVDNSARVDVPPLAGDFTMFGGLYRHVRLITVPDISIDLMDFAGPGVYLQSTLGPRDAALRATVRVFNARSEARHTRLVLKLLGEGEHVDAESCTDHLALSGVTPAELVLSVNQPRLWQGRTGPALYRVVTEVHADGVLQDSLAQAYGFRSFRVDAERGFLLNDEPYPLYGISLHQDRAPQGWAVNEQGLQEDFRILAELGASFVRVVHYQSHPALYDLCDRYGYVAWAEHALVNQAAVDALFAERALTQLTELIRQNFNRPSIAFWGLSNELQTRSRPEARALLERLALLCKREDPSRLSTLATNHQEPGGSYGEEVTAHNNYLGWYGGNFSDLALWLDRQRAKAPSVPLGLSEYGAGAGANIHYDAPAMMDHSEEYQCLYHEAAWQAIAQRPWLFCSAIWCLFDFPSGQRAEGEQLGINDKGLVTRDRQTKKDAFYFYKAQWSREPFVYIAGRRFVARTQAKIRVKVYTNLPLVELVHNGRCLGAKAPAGGVALWDDVELTPWANQLQAKTAAAIDTVVWILNVFYNPWAEPSPD